MTSPQKKKGGGTEAERQSVLKQMKVRTTLKKDMSWINHNSDDEKDECPSPLSGWGMGRMKMRMAFIVAAAHGSPQLKSLGAKRFICSPTPETKFERDSTIYKAEEINKSSSTPFSSSNTASTYKVNETHIASEISASSQPLSTDNNSRGAMCRAPGSRTSAGYIIRGQPINASTPIKIPVPFNGYKKSNTAQLKSASLPRLPTATGYKMSTEEYKKLAPFNTRNRSLGDLSDEDEIAFSPEEHTQRTEVASGLLRNTPSKDRSYVFSAAKRNNGTGAQETPPPFLAKRVEVQEEQGENKRSQTLPKSLSSYLYDDANRYEQSWKATNAEQSLSSSQTSPPSGNYNSGSPKLTSWTTGNVTETRSTDIKPVPGKITVIRDESDDDKEVPKSTSETRSTTTRSSTSRNEGGKNNPDIPKLTSWTTGPKSPNIKTAPGKVTVIRDGSSGAQDTPPPFLAKWVDVQEEQGESIKSQTLPKSLSSYLYDDANRVGVQEEQGENKKSQTLPKSLSSYLYDDANRYEQSWKAINAEQSLSSSQTSPPSNDKTSKETEKSYTTDNIRTTTVKGKDGIPMLSKHNVVSGNYNSDSPKLTSWTTGNVTETRNTDIKPVPGKITVIRDESDDDKEVPKSTSETRSTTTRSSTTRNGGGKNNPDIPKLTSWTTGPKSPNIKTAPGKVTVIRDGSDDDNKVPKTTAESRSTTRTIETSNERNNNSDIPKLTSWTTTSVTETREPDTKPGTGKITVLRDERNNNSDIPKLTSLTTTSVTETRNPDIKPGHGKITVLRDESVQQEPLPQVDTKPKVATTEARDNKQPDLISWSELGMKSTITENRELKEDCDVPKPTPRNTNKDKEKSVMEAPLIVISPEFNSTRPNPPSKAGAISTVNETRYRVPETLEELEPIPNSRRYVSDSGNNSVVTTRYESSRATEQAKPDPSNSPRPSPRNRENISTTTTEARYRVPESLENTTVQSNPARSSSHSTVTSTAIRSTEPKYTEYLEEKESRSTRIVSSSREKITTTTVETRYDSSSANDLSEYDPQSANKGILFVKEYLNTSESVSPTYTGSQPDFSESLERSSFSSSSYLYNSAPKRPGEGNCTYCGREIKDCAKIILEHLNIYCHEFCFKCGICNKPMGDLIDNLFIHRDVVHCENCYEKLF
ncbi:zinc finger protein 185 isoform X4 [Ascaphus truei]|uniref:zinc finger protein 185 isoform X4 n=1 Tax=Ascaphus truei TaxID=8439 RepID=UPI003F59FF22